MAEPIGVASGLLALAAFSFKSSVSLHETVCSFRSHVPRVRDLAEELIALNGVLGSLNETVRAMPDLDVSTLTLPLLRCGKACKDFEEALLRCSSRSSEKRTSFRDWAKLVYMGEDIDGFRRLLNGYKLTISIALTDVNLRRSSATAESLEIYNELISTTQADLEDRLKMIDRKLQLIIQRNGARSGPADPEVTSMQEERLSTEQGLQICAQLSEHIRQLQVSASGGRDEDTEGSAEPSPHRLTVEGLQECRESLARTTLQLQGYETQLVHRIIETSRSAASSEEDRLDLVRLRDEWEATRQGVDICARAHSYLDSGASTIDNYAIGDAVQIMVSTTEKTIHGKNRGLGWRTRQVGGHISNEALMQIAVSLGSVSSQVSGAHERSPPNEASSASGSGRGSGVFRGEGHKLTSELETGGRFAPSTTRSFTGKSDS